MKRRVNAVSKIFKVKFKNTDLYSFVDDAVLEDALQGVFPRAVLEVREIGDLKELIKKNDALQDVPETDG